MKFVTLTKIASASLAAIFAVALVGCGSDSNLTLTQGNWSIAATSNGGLARQSSKKHKSQIKSNVSADFFVGGNLTQTGSNVAGTMYIVGSDCLDSSSGIAFTGTVKGTQVTLTSPSLEGQVITITASGTSTSTTTSLTGTYAVTGTGCDVGDTGTLTANLVAPITGTWSGPLSNCDAGVNGCSNATISIDMTQATTVSTDGTFALTGNITYTNSGCGTVSGTITGGFIAGQFVTLNANTTDTSEGTESFTYDFALLDNPTTPLNMTGTYDVSGGNCDGSEQVLTLSLN
jgi:hypothetical protein